jgi:hypothetical protein
LQRLARGLDASPQTGKPGFDPLREAVVHGLLLALALLRAHQDEGLAAVRPLADLGLHAFAHDVPVVCIEQLLGKALELVLVGTDVVRAGHATIHDPDAMGLTVPFLHRVHDVLDRGHIHAIAIEHLVAERHALARDHERDAYLLAVGTVIATVTAFGHGIARGLALEIRARDVVEQKLVVE